ncbi:MAG TPA: DinB family protein [Kineosporiaceae bacterium]|nr:DinB family protein [Kineosporiaceae bacterium]
MTIEPDTKDWTWVLQRPCPECGLDTRAVDVRQVPRLIDENARSWHQVLTSRPDVRDRPAPAVWSPLEYGCHVRDVLRLFDRRLQLMLTEDDPSFANWDQDATALEDDYAAQDPVTVAGQLREAASTLAARFASVEGEQWQRTGGRSDGARFTVDSFARYFLHDIVHHVHDVGAA